jgi:hypothetical protein
MEALCELTEGMDNLLIFLSGRNPVVGREYLIDRKQEILTLRMKANRLHEQGFSIKEITQKIFPGDDIFDLLTNGELSSQNLIISLLEWKS